MASMVPTLNKKSGLLEPGFQFNDTPEPNLFRNMYPYNDILGIFLTSVSCQ